MWNPVPLVTQAALAVTQAVPMRDKQCAVRALHNPGPKTVGAPQHSSAMGLTPLAKSLTRAFTDAPSLTSLCTTRRPTPPVAPATSTLASLKRSLPAALIKKGRLSSAVQQ